MYCLYWLMVTWKRTKTIVNPLVKPLFKAFRDYGKSPRHNPGMVLVTYIVWGHIYRHRGCANRRYSDIACLGRSSNLHPEDVYADLASLVTEYGQSLSTA